LRRTSAPQLKSGRIVFKAIRVLNVPVRIVTMSIIRDEQVAAVI